MKEALALHAARRSGAGFDRVGDGAGDELAACVCRGGFILDGFPADFARRLSRCKQLLVSEGLS